MKKAVLVSFVATTRIIIEGDEPTDAELEKAVVRASANLSNDGLSLLDSVTDDNDCVYGTLDEDETN